MIKRIYNICNISNNIFISKDISIAGNPRANPPVPAEAAIQITRATFPINNAKLFVSVYNIKFLENVNQGFKKIISWKKYRSKIKTQTESNNVYYLFDPTFRNINRLFEVGNSLFFIQSFIQNPLFKNDNDDPIRDSFDKYHIPLVKSKKLKH